MNIPSKQTSRSIFEYLGIKGSYILLTTQPISDRSTTTQNKMTFQIGMHSPERHGRASLYHPDATEQSAAIKAINELINSYLQKKEATQGDDQNGTPPETIFYEHNKHPYIAQTISTNDNKSGTLTTVVKISPISLKNAQKTNEITSLLDREYLQQFLNSLTNTANLTIITGKPSASKQLIALKFLDFAADAKKTGTFPIINAPKHIRVHEVAPAEKPTMLFPRFEISRTETSKSSMLSVAAKLLEADPTAIVIPKIDSPATAFLAIHMANIGIPTIATIDASTIYQALQQLTIYASTLEDVQTIRNALSLVLAAIHFIRPSGSTDPETKWVAMTADTFTVSDISRLETKHDYSPKESTTNKSINMRQLIRDNNIDELIAIINAQIEKQSKQSSKEISL